MKQNSIFLLLWGQQCFIEKHQGFIERHQRFIEKHQCFIEKHQRLFEKHQSFIERHQRFIEKHQWAIERHQAFIEKHQWIIERSLKSMTIRFLIWKFRFFHQGLIVNECENEGMMGDMGNKGNMKDVVLIHTTIGWLYLYF